MRGWAVAAATSASDMAWPVAAKLLEMEEVPLRVTDDGRTVIDEQARKVRCATRWKDLPAFEDELVRRLTSGA